MSDFEETSFNDDGIPNLEIYTECEDSYEARFGRNIGGTSTYLSWSRILQFWCR